MSQIENIIIRSMIYNDDYMRGVIPHIKSEYFTNEYQREIFIQVKEYIEKYNSRPTNEALEIAISNNSDVTERTFEEIGSALKDYKSKQLDVIDVEWLTNETEKWCINRSVANAVYQCIGIIEGEERKLTIDSMPEILKDALGVSFDQSIGHDFLDDAEARYDFYNTDIERIPFGLDYLNRITGGGVPRKTLNILMGGTGGFKSGTMCSFAADYLVTGRNVLYITLELSEERVAERIDANLLDVELDALRKLPRADYIKRVNSVKNKTNGKLIVKEYPTASAHTGHFRHLLRELELKKGFKPDVIMVDYVNIMTSSRTTMASGSYGYVKAIAEELRGLAVEFDVPIWSATQTNRSGYADSDVGLENTSESFGLPATADMFLALINNEELETRGQLMFKQLKNRYGDLNKFNKFVVGKDGAKMRLYDAEESAQSGILDTSGNAGNNMSQDQKDAMKEAIQIPTFTTNTNNSLVDQKNKFDNFNY